MNKTGVDLNNTRMIPCLLLQEDGFVKTRRFKDPVYLGDPINIVRIFNDKEADELAILDIGATIEGRPPAFDILENIAAECFMPLSYGGGIRTLADARRILKSGYEKVCLNTAVVENPQLLSEVAREFGSSSVIVSIDVLNRKSDRYEVMIHGGRIPTGLDPVTAARQAEENGAGEILLTSIDRDGQGGGYDLPLIKSVSSTVGIPIIAAGGAGSLLHLIEAVIIGGASAVAAGSFFVFHGPYRSVLINMPCREDFITGLSHQASIVFPERN